jgi:hypothetical protein
MLYRGVSPFETLHQPVTPFKACTVGSVHHRDTHRDQVWQRPQDTFAGESRQEHPSYLKRFGLERNLCGDDRSRGITLGGPRDQSERDGLSEPLGVSGFSFSFSNPLSSDVVKR